MKVTVAFFTDAYFRRSRWRTEITESHIWEFGSTCKVPTKMFLWGYHEVCFQSVSFRSFAFWIIVLDLQIRLEKSFMNWNFPIEIKSLDNAYLLYILTYICWACSLPWPCNIPQGDELSQKWDQGSGSGVVILVSNDL